MPGAYDRTGIFSRDHRPNVMRSVDGLEAFAALAVLEAGEALPEPVRLFLSIAAACYLSGDCQTADAALGLERLPGARDHRTVLRHARRDQAIREAAALLRGHPSISARADLIASRMRNYRVTGWRRDRTESVCPKRLHGTLEGHLWAALKQVDSVLSQRNIRRLLATSSTYSWPTNSGILHL